SDIHRVRRVGQFTLDSEQQCKGFTRNPAGLERDPTSPTRKLFPINSLLLVKSVKAYALNERCQTQLQHERPFTANRPPTPQRHVVPLPVDAADVASPACSHERAPTRLRRR